MDLYYLNIIFLITTITQSIARPARVRVPAVVPAVVSAVVVPQLSGCQEHALTVQRFKTARHSKKMLHFLMNTNNVNIKKREKGRGKKGEEKRGRRGRKEIQLLENTEYTDLSLHYSRKCVKVAVISIHACGGLN